jgi:hypothetical protein
VRTEHLESLITLSNVIGRNKKHFQIAGKGHNKTLEIVKPVEELTVANGAVEIHVPENGGTCEVHCRVKRRVTLNQSQSTRIDPTTNFYM